MGGAYLPHPSVSWALGQVQPNSRGGANNSTCVLSPFDRQKGGGHFKSNRPREHFQESSGGSGGSGGGGNNICGALVYNEGRRFT